MSGSKDKQKRKGLKEQGLDLRNPQEIEADRARQRQNKTVVGVLIAFAVVAVILLVINSNAFYRNATAFKAGDEKFSITEMSYFYYQSYQYLMYNEYGMYFLDTSVSLKDQAYDENSSYHDYVSDMSKDNARLSAMLYTRAVEEGLTLTEEYEEQIQEALDSYEENYEESGFTSANAMVQYQYGKGMNNLDRLRDQLEYVYLGQTYADLVIDNFTDSYSEEELEEQYSEIVDEYDFIDYRIYSVYYDVNVEPEETEDGDIIEYEEVDEEANRAEAEETAEAIAEAAEQDGEEGFIQGILDTMDEDEAEDYDPDNTITQTQGASLEGYEYEQWLLDGSREEGDVTVVEDEAVFYVLYYLGREDNHYNRLNVRHILLAPETVETEDEDGEAIDADIVEAAEEEALAEALERAEAVMEEWESSDGTEETFAELAQIYSDDDASIEDDNGGLYEAVAKNEMMDEFDEWIYDESRKAGDVDMVQTSYGYHIIYYIGEDDMLYSSYIAQQVKLSEDYQEWEEEALEDFPTSSRFLMRFVRSM